MSGLSETQSGHKEFNDRLREFKAASKFSYQALSGELGRPVSTIHGWISGRHLPYARDKDDFERLLTLLGCDNAAPLMSRLARIRDAGTGVSIDNPYKGLESFTEDDARVFYGRDTLAQTLQTRLIDGLNGDNSHLLVVIGASGAGKTSLLRAGLSARLRATGRYGVHYLTPGNDAIAALSAAINSSSGRERPAGGDIVIVDQFEELFGDANAGMVDRFISLLADLQGRRGTALVIGLRADFFHRAAAIPFLLEALQLNQALVGPMSTEEVTDCIMLPAHDVGLTVASDLLTELLAKFALQAGSNGSTEALPLLSHVLYLLAESPHGDRLTLHQFHEIGGLQSALQRSADGVWSKMSTADQQASKFLFTRLIELGFDSLPTRRTIELDSLKESAGDLALEHAIDEFAINRLLTADTNSITISHEALLTAWPRLIGWIDQDRDSMVTARRVSTAAHSWEEAGREVDLLLRGSRLDAAISLLVNPSVAARLTDAERSFVSESREAHQVRLRERSKAVSRQLSVQASTLQDIDPSLSMQIALVANQTSSTVESRSVLLGATSPLPGARYLGGSGPTALAISHGGRRVAFSNSLDGSVSILDRGSGSFHRQRQFQIASPDADIYALALSPDGRLLASGGSDRLITISIVESGETLICPADGDRAFDDDVTSIAFDTSGRHLFAAGSTHGVGCWCIRNDNTAEFEGSIPASGVTTAIAVSSDNRLLATGGRDGTVELWDLQHRSDPFWTDESVDRGPAAAICLSPDGSTLVAGYHSGQIRAWNLADRVRLSEIQIDAAPFASWVNHVEMSPGGQILAAASSDGHVRLWNTRTWRDLKIDLHHPTVVICAQFLSELSLVTSAEDGTLRVWDLPEQALAPSEASIWSLTFDSSGRRMATSSRNRAAIWRIDQAGAQSVETEMRPPGPGVTFSGASCLSPDGQLLAVGTRQGSVILVHTGDGSRDDDNLSGLTSLVENLAISPDGSMLCGVDQDGHVQIWMIDSSGSAMPGGSAKVSPGAMCPAFDCTSTMLAVASESGEVSVFDVADPSDPMKAAVVNTGDSFALYASFHPTKPYLAVANADRSVGLWDCSDPSDPTLVSRLTGPGGKVMTVAFSPSGEHVAAGITDGKVWIWNVEDLDSPSVHAVIQSKEQGVYSLAFSPDGRYLTGAGPRQRVFSWIIDENYAAEVVCSAAGDLITPSEWSRLMPSIPYRRLEAAS